MEVIVNQLAVFVFNNLVAANCSYRLDIILPQINFLVFLSLFRPLSYFQHLM
jgi:hypothetical protein